jgi:hypothetical protein
MKHALIAAMLLVGFASYAIGGRSPQYDPGISKYAYETGCLHMAQDMADHFRNERTRTKIRELALKDCGPMADKFQSWIRNK